MRYSPVTSSVTLLVLENGALNTGMPWRDADSRSTWLVPMQKLTDSAELLGGVKHVIGKMSAGTDADEMNILDLLDELIVIKRALQILYLVVAGAVKRINRTRVDALKEKNLDLVFVQGITSH